MSDIALEGSYAIVLALVTGYVIRIAGQVRGSEGIHSALTSFLIPGLVILFFAALVDTLDNLDYDLLSRGPMQSVIENGLLMAGTVLFGVGIAKLVSSVLDISKENRARREEVSAHEKKDKIKAKILQNLKGATGEDYFHALTKSMKEVLGVDWVYAAENQRSNSSVVSVIAGYGPNGIIEDFSYDITGTPCDTALEDHLCVLKEKVQEKFPEDSLLVDMNIEGYAGVSLVNSAGSPLGLLVVLDSKPLENEDLIFELLDTFSARASAELSRKIADEDRDRLQRQLQHSQRMEVMGALAGGIAHDFNNVLTPIMGYSQILLQDLSEENASRQDAQEILDGAKRARALVKQILDFSRQGRSEKVESLQVKTLVKNSVKFVSATLPANIDIQIDTNKDDPWIQADPHQIDQVLMNIMTNAWHSMDDVGGTILITCDLWDADADFCRLHPPLVEGAVVRIAIKDKGSGIPEEIKAKVFEPFFTTKGSGRGTGFGLSTSLSIVNSLKGTITLESKEGEGSCFTIIIPAYDFDKMNIVPVDDWCRPERVDRAIADQTRILFVDDEAHNLRIGQRIFEGLGFQVEAFIDSEEALSAFEADPGRYDILVTDQSMPNLQGHELAEAVRAINAKLPVIVVSGYGNEKSKHHYAKLGIKTLVRKPFEINQIEDALDQALAEVSAAD